MMSQRPATGAFTTRTPDSPDAQTALIRWARLTEQLSADKRDAAALYIELLQRFPNGSQSLYAETALRRLGVERPPTDFLGRQFRRHDCRRFAT